MRISDWSSDVCSSDLIRFTRSGREDGDRRLNSVAPCQSHSIQRVLMLVHIVRAWGNLMASNGDMSVNEDRIMTQPLSCSVALRRTPSISDAGLCAVMGEGDVQPTGAARGRRQLRLAQTDVRRQQLRQHGGEPQRMQGEEKG